LGAWWEGCCSEEKITIRLNKEKLVQR